MQRSLIIHDLYSAVEEPSVLNGLRLTIEPSSVHAIMGPNGSGKSTLARTIMGHPHCTVTAGSITYAGHDLVALSPDKRAQLGIFLAFQNPCMIPGVSVFTLLKEAYQVRHSSPVDVRAFREQVLEKLMLLDMDASFLERSVHDGFSGGEKKKLEVLQLLVLQPSFIILDEIDSGLDIDALKTVAAAMTTLRVACAPSILIITHYQRILDYITPDYVHIMRDGVLVQSGTMSLVSTLEQQGYDAFRTT